MHRGLWIGLVVVIIAVISWLMWGSANSGKPKIYVVSIVEIEPISQLREGFYEHFRTEGYDQQFDFIERNAQGDNGLIVQIADEIASKTPSLVYVLGTPIAQAIQTRSPDVIIVQGAVTDPIAAGLADGWDASGRNYAATSDKPPIDQMIELLQQVFPDRVSIGVVFNPSEANSVSIVEQIKASPSRGPLEVLEFAVSSPTDLPIAASSAAANSDVLFIPPDNLVTSGIETVIATANAFSKPIMATTSDAVSLGATIAISTDFYDLGVQSAEIAVRILIEGVPPQEMPIEPPADMKVFVSESRVQEFGGSLGQIEPNSIVEVD